MDINMKFKIPSVEKIIEIVGGFITPVQKMLSNKVDRLHVTEVLEASKNYSQTELLKGALFEVINKKEFSEDTKNLFALSLAEDFQDKLEQKINLSQIGIKTIDYLPENVTSEQVSNEFKVHFKEKAKFVSDEAMQTLWAKILAEEIQAPGSFRMRTLNTLEYLSKNELEVFQNISDFVLHNFNDYFIFAESSNTNPNQSLINYGDLLLLDSLNLISINKSQKTVQYKNITNNESTFINSNKIVTIKTNNILTLNFQAYILTPIGKELFILTNPNYNERYILNFANHFIKYNAEVSISEMVKNQENLYESENERIIVKQKTKPLF